MQSRQLFLRIQICSCLFFQRILQRLFHGIVCRSTSVSVFFTVVGKRLLRSIQVPLGPAYLYLRFFRRQAVLLCRRCLIVCLLRRTDILLTSDISKLQLLLFDFLSLVQNFLLQQLRIYREQQIPLCDLLSFFYRDLHYALIRLRHDRHFPVLHNLPGCRDSVQDHTALRLLHVHRRNSRLIRCTGQDRKAQHHCKKCCRYPYQSASVHIPLLFHMSHTLLLIYLQIPACSPPVCLLFQVSLFFGYRFFHTSANFFCLSTGVSLLFTVCRYFFTPSAPRL